MSYKVEVVSTSPKCEIGEGPHWDEGTQSLYYVDIHAKGDAVLRYDFREDKVYSAKIDGEPVVSFIIPVAGSPDHFAVGLRRRVAVIEWDGFSSKTRLKLLALEVEDDPKYTKNRINDGKADPYGRLYCGTMRSEEFGNICEVASGSLYRYIKGEGARALLDNIYLSNGLAWDEKQNKFYYIDSCQKEIKSFDYDPKSGDISNYRQVIDFRKSAVAGLPDGMTICSEGNLYVAMFNGSKVLKIDPVNGKILLEIDIPALQITSVAFGGPNLDILYVTTAGKILFENKELPPLSGQLFKVTGLNAKGLPAVKVRV